MICRFAIVLGVMERPRRAITMAPRLAGQRADYLVNQLQAFATHKRDEFLSTKYMWNAAAHLDPLTATKSGRIFFCASARGREGRRQRTRRRGQDNI